VREIAPRALGIDAAASEPHALGSVDWTFLRSAQREGWLTSLVPRALGGGGARTTEIAAVTEELCAACGGLGLLVGANGLGLSAPVFSLDAGIWRRVVVPAVAEHGEVDRPTLFAWAITEPSSGSDVEDGEALDKILGCTWAERVQGGYRLHGRKAFTSNGSIARWIVVHAAVDRARPRETWTAFLVDTRAQGYSSARDERKLGQRASPATETVYDGVFVPELDRVGPEGLGFPLTELVLSGSRGPVGAIATGIARGALEATLRAVRSLEAGHPCSASQGWVRDTLGEMTARLHAARLCYLDAASGFDHDLVPPAWVDDAFARAGTLAASVLPEHHVKRTCESLLRRFLRELSESGRLAHQLARASIAKSFCADVSMWICDRACDLVPPGHAERPRVDKAFRDAKLTQIYEGTNQINRLSIADAALGRG
jgi:acyl-CoA dehydrogenase